MTKEDKSTKSKKVANKRFRNPVLGLIIILIVFGLFLFGHSIVYAQKVLPKVTIGGVNLSGLSKSAAEQELDHKIEDIKTVKFNYQDKSWELKLEDIGVIYDKKASLESAYSLGKSGNIGQRLVDQVSSIFKHHDLPMKYLIDESKFISIVDENIAETIEDKETETQLVVQNGEPKIIAGKKGKRIDQEDLISKTKTFLNRPQADKKIAINVEEAEPRVSVDQAQNSKTEAKKIIASSLILKSKDKEFVIEPNLISSWIIGKVEEKTDEKTDELTYILIADINTQKVKTYVQALAGEINKEPGNARITMEDGQIKILQSSFVGQVLNEDETVKLIIETLLKRKDSSLNQKVDLIIEEKQPEISTNNVYNLGIKELIGRAATDFTTSPENRKHNIGVGANFLSGIIIKDGEEFSALKYLGNVDASQGYLPELVINNNKLESEYGGGLCQNATTLFRAVMDAGLPITQRQNHSRRVSYYEKAISIPGIHLTFNQDYASIGGMLVGYDATVFIPQPDLKFKNNTGKAILVQEYVENNVIYAEIYGTKDGRTPVISKAEVLSTKPTPATIYHDASDLPLGTNKVITKGGSGAKTKFTYTIKYSDGKEESQEFISNYRAIAPEIQVGSKQ